ncbi:hypothetical protein GQ54DRAFT_295529 [Martensiomyces pterosporus]|nr:hypothetical protein GQ54DRAFT_295529 [Martensiomyces pterosporus]
MPVHGAAREAQRQVRGLSDPCRHHLMCTLDMCAGRQSIRRMRESCSAPRAGNPAHFKLNTACGRHVAIVAGDKVRPVLSKRPLLSGKKGARAALFTQPPRGGVRLAWWIRNADGDVQKTNIHSADVACEDVWAGQQKIQGREQDVIAGDFACRQFAC